MSNPSRNRAKQPPTSDKTHGGSRKRRAVRAVRSAAWRHRWYSLPTGTATASLVAAGVGNLADCEPITMGTSAVLMAATGWGGVTSTRERGLYFGIGAGNLAWQGAAAVAEHGPLTSPLPALLLAGTVAASSAWAWLRVAPLRAPDIAREMRRWEGTKHEIGLFELVGLEGCHLADVRRVYASKGPAALPIGWDYRIELAHGKTTPAAVKRALPQIENALRVRAGAVTMIEDADRRHQVTLRCIPVRVWSNSAPVEHPLSPLLSSLLDATRRIEAAHTSGDLDSLGNAQLDADHVAWMPRQRSIAEPLPLGVYEDGTAAFLDMWTPGHGAFHILVGGVSGSGKTNLLNTMFTHLAACRDAQVWGIDIAKSGRNLAPWAGAIRWVASSADEAMAMLRAGAQVTADRGRAYPIEDSPTLEPRPDRPQITLVIDEAAALLSETKNPDALEAAELIAQIAQQGRELGVQLILVTQRPTVESLGGGNAGTILAQLITRLCLKVNKQTEAMFVLRDWDQFDPSAFYAKGMVLAQTDEGSDPLPIRIYWSSTPSTVKRVNALYGPYRPDLDGPTERGVRTAAGPYWPASTPAPASEPASAPARAREHEHTSEPEPAQEQEMPVMSAQPSGLAAELAEQLATEDEPASAAARTAHRIEVAARTADRSPAGRAQRTAASRAQVDVNAGVYDAYRERMVPGGAEAGTGVALAELARQHLGDDTPTAPDDELTRQCLDWLGECGDRGESVQAMARKFGTQAREVSDRLTQVARALDTVERSHVDEQGRSWWRVTGPVEADAAETLEGDDPVLAELAAAGEAGASTPQLTAVLGWKPHNTRRRLKSLEDAGRVARTGERRSTRWYVTGRG